MTNPLRRFERRLCRGILWLAPWLMKGLSVVGTLAMFLVGGGILTHGLPWLQHALENWAQMVTTWVTNLAAPLSYVAAALGWATPLLGDALAGLLAGAAAWLVMGAVKRFRGAAVTQ